MKDEKMQLDISVLEKRRNRKRNTIPALSMTGPVAFWMIVFVLLPLIYIVIISFMTRDAYGGIEYRFTLQNYTDMIQPIYLKVIWKSIKLAFLTTAICLLIGYPFAYYIARKPSKLAAKLLMLIMIPFWTNTLVRLYSINLLGQPNSFLNKFLLSIGAISKPLDILYSDGIVVIGLLISMLPFAVLPLYASIEKLDKAYLEASGDLGARPSVTFWRITVPLTLPGIVASIILVFIPSLGMYYVPEMLGGGKVMLIGNLIRNQFLVTKNWPFGASLSILLILITLAMLWLYTRISRLDEMEVL
jgi:spermidine/putrescine transport system permease protein